MALKKYKYSCNSKTNRTKLQSEIHTDNSLKIIILAQILNLQSYCLTT